MDIIILLLDTNIRNASEDEMSRLKSRLLVLWQNYANDTGFDGVHMLFSNSADCKHLDELSALTILYFNCAAMLLSSTLPVPITPPTGSLGVLECCNSTFECVEYLENKSIGCAYMRMMLPLVLVALKGPSTALRERACNTLKTWKANGIMPGLCTMALGGIKRLCIQT